MRRDGVLTGYLWNRNSFGKVKVKGKPTNASKASGRCGRAKCSKCHEQPVSKAKSKTKGRNKRAMSRLLVDDEWAFCKHTPAHRINAVLSVPSHVDHDDIDDYAYDVRDACHAEAKLMDHNVNNDDLDADNAHDNHDVNEAHNVRDAGVHARDDVTDVLTAMFTCKVLALDGSLYTVTYPIPVASGFCAKANDVIINDDDGDVNHGCHAMTLHAEDDVALEDDDSNANQEGHAMIVHAADDVSDDDTDDDAVHDDDDTNDFQSLISGLVNVEWPTHDDNEEVSDVESEENSLSSDWCHVASSDVIDDWYMC